LVLSLFLRDTAGTLRREAGRGEVSTGCWTIEHLKWPRPGALKEWDAEEVRRTLGIEKPFFSDQPSVQALGF
jgi:hypothetical protein